MVRFQGNAPRLHVPFGGRIARDIQITVYARTSRYSNLSRFQRDGVARLHRCVSAVDDDRALPDVDGQCRRGAIVFDERSIVVKRSVNGLRASRRGEFILIDAPEYNAECGIATRTQYHDLLANLRHRPRPHTRSRARLCPRQPVRKQPIRAHAHASGYFIQLRNHANQDEIADEPFVLTKNAFYSVRDV